MFLGVTGRAQLKTPGSRWPQIAIVIAGSVGASLPARLELDFLALLIGYWVLGTGYMRGTTLRNTWGVRLPGARSVVFILLFFFFQKKKS